MQVQARCNSATSPFPKHQNEDKKAKKQNLLFLSFNWMIHLKKHPVVNLYNENTSGIYI